MPPGRKVAPSGPGEQIPKAVEARPPEKPKPPSFMKDDMKTVVVEESKIATVEEEPKEVD